MSTKIITVGASTPAVSTGADFNKGAPLNAAEFDQNLANLRGAVDAKATNLLTGYISGAGTVAATDTVLQAISKLNGNDSIAASETVSGRVELATAAETTTGTDNTRAVHPAGLKVELDKKAVLAGSATQDFAAKTVTANNIGDMPLPQGVVTTYAASGSTGIQIADNDNLDFGTGDFTLIWKGSLPDWTPATVNTALLSRYSLATNQVLLRVNTTGKLQYYQPITGGTTISAATTNATNFTDGTTHNICCVITRETVSASGSAAFYIDGVLFESIVIPAGTPASTSLGVPLQVLGEATTRYAATTQAVHAYNRSLTAAEVLAHYRNGVAESDKWGSQAAVYTSNFSAGVDGFAPVASSATVDGNIDGIAGMDNCLRIYASANTTNHRFARTAALVTPGKRYRRSLQYYIPAANTNVKKIKFYSGETLLVEGSVLDTWTTITSYGETGVNVYGLDCYMYNAGGSYNFMGAGVATDDLVYIRDVVVTPLGATLALEPEGIQPAPGQWLDSTSNKLHALQPATGSSLARKKDSFEIRWTNTWAGTHEAQYIGGVNQAILPPNCYIESIVGVVSGATIEDIIVGDGSNTSQWVTITTGLSTGTQTFAIANRVSDGTNRKMVVDPDTNFTGSISWVIKGMIL